jgi:ATP-dependent DNA helicase RecG
LSDYPFRQRALWAKLQTFAWEANVALPFLEADEVLSKLDYAAYFELTSQRLPDNRKGIFDRLEADRLIQKDVGGGAVGHHQSGRHPFRQATGRLPCLHRA